MELHHQTVKAPVAKKSGTRPPPIVICHGLLGNSGNWLGVARTLAEVTGRDVVLPDARNHGLSPHSSEHDYQHLATDLRYIVPTTHVV